MFSIIPEIQEKKVKGICAFDFDDTLVSKDGDLPLYKNTKRFLESCYEKGFTIVIFTNQGGIAKNKTTLENVEKRLRSFISAKCLKLAKETVKLGKSVIIDNTNGDIEVRKLYADIARSSNYRILYIVFTITKELAMHLDEMRVDTLNVSPIPAIAFNTFFKKYRETPPTLSECDELIEYVPNYPKELFKLHF